MAYQINNADRIKVIIVLKFLDIRVVPNVNTPYNANNQKDK
jgi:hypothetical protein